MAGHTFLVPVPPYVSWHKRTPIIRRWPAIAVALTFMALVLASWELLNATGLHRRTGLEALCLYGACALTALGFVLLSWAYRETRKATWAIRKILMKPNQFVRLERDLARMFGARVQNRFAVGGIILLLAAIVLMNPGLPPLSYVFFLLLATAGSAVLGYGFGLAATTMYWIHSLPKYGPMRLFILPSYTPALRAASRLTGFFALLFVVESSAAIGLFLSIPWKYGTVVSVVTWTVAAPVVCLGVGLCFYPQFAIRRVVVKRLRILMAKYSQVTESDPAVDATDESGSLVPVVDLYARLQSSPSFALDFFTSVQFAASAAIAVWAMLNHVVGEESLRQGIWSAAKALVSRAGL